MAIEITPTVNSTVVLTFGKYKGQPITSVPPGYLEYCVREGILVEEAEAELKRRGTFFSDVHLSPHAVDRVSLRMMPKYLTSRKPNEGLYTWICRKFREAIDKGKEDTKGQLVYEGWIWVYQTDVTVPLLKTVLPLKGR